MYTMLYTAGFFKLVSVINGYTKRRQFLIVLKENDQKVPV
jgi:hypothetical protein